MGQSQLQEDGLEYKTDSLVPCDNSITMRKEDKVKRERERERKAKVDGKKGR